MPSDGSVKIRVLFLFFLRVSAPSVLLTSRFEKDTEDAAFGHGLSPGLSVCKRESGRWFLRRTFLGPGVKRAGRRLVSSVQRILCALDSGPGKSPAAPSAPFGPQKPAPAFAFAGVLSVQSLVAAAGRAAPLR